MIPHNPYFLILLFLIPSSGKDDTGCTTKPDFHTYYKLTARTKLSKPQMRVCMLSEILYDVKPQ